VIAALDTEPTRQQGPGVGEAGLTVSMSHTRINVETHDGVAVMDARLKPVSLIAVTVGRSKFLIFLEPEVAFCE
jgi:hypothetical protein